MTGLVNIFNEIFQMKIWLALMFLAIEGAGFSQTDAFRIKNFNLSDGIGIKGYDPVTYFTGNKAVKGNRELVSSYRGIKYFFSNQTSQELFKSNPAKYEPQYGGWCAYAMGTDGSKVDIDPSTFKIVDGKLFLFYNRFFNNTLKSWNANEGKLHMQADENWSNILKHI
jgi:YHS domain-containing protein